MHRDLKPDKVKTNRRKKSEFESNIDFLSKWNMLTLRETVVFSENNIIPFVCLESASEPKNTYKT